MTQLFPSIDNTPISGFPTEYFNRGLLADDRLRSRVAVPDTEIFADAAFLIGGNRPEQVIPGIQMDFRVAAIVYAVPCRTGVPRLTSRYHLAQTREQEL
jgi:hypothetical protein